MEKDKKGSIITFIRNLRKKDKDTNKLEVNEDLFEKCPKCYGLVARDILIENLWICPQCNYHFKMNAKNRVNALLEDYRIINKPFKFSNPLDFPGYEEKHKEYERNTGMQEGILTAEGLLNGIKTLVVVMDNSFLMGSMGSYIGDEITKAFEYGKEKSLPIIIFSTSGGARMQEGIFSLMQMAKTSLAVKQYGESKNLFISYMTNPTTGGVTASFASLGDIIIAEPEALIGFAGPRVIKETIKGELPEGFQSAEFLLENGFLDDIIDRKNMKDFLYRCLKLHGYGGL